MKYKLFALLTLALFASFSTQLSTLRAQGTAFTYQGRLNDAGSPANGGYDLTFALFNVSTGSGQIGQTLTNLNTAVSNGLFTVTLDFGNQFPGADRWLEIGVANVGGAITTLTPRQRIGSTPYAVRASNVSGTVAATQLIGEISTNNIGAGSITTVMLAAGAVGSNQLAAGAVTSSKVATVSNWFGLTIPNPSPAAGDRFGNAVAAVGSNQLLIGAQFDDAAAADAGAVYLFNTDGTLLNTFTSPTPASLNYFGRSVAGVGTDLVLIGEDRGDAGALNAGAAYLFNVNGTLLTTFTNPTPAANDSFGYSVAPVGSDRFLVSAPGDGGSGVAYLFSTNGSLLATFNNPAPVANDAFGISIAALGSDRVLVGSIGANSGAGGVYLFNTNGTFVRIFSNPTPAANDWFGASLAALGSDRVLIGSLYDDTGASDAGAAYLFNTNGSLLTTFTNPAPAANGNFGFPLAVLGNDRLLIGASGNNAGSGMVYLFSTNGTLLKTFTNPTPAANDAFGASLAVVGNEGVLIGANGDDLAVNDAGTAYLFGIGSYTPGLVADGVRADSITGASLRDGSVSASKISGVLFASQIPDLDAGKITSGTLAEGRLPGNVALLDRDSPDPTNPGQVFTGENIFNNTNNSFTGTFIGNGSGLSNLNAARLTGVLGAAQIPGLNASNITSGTVADARLSTNVALRSGGNAFSGNQSIVGTLGVGTVLPQGTLHVYSANNPTVVRVQSTGTPGAARLEFVSNPQGDVNEWRPGFIESADSGGFTGGLSFNVNGTGAINKFAAVEVMRIVNGRVGIGTNNPQSALQVVGTVTATAFNPPSDRNLKENFTPVSPREVLEKVTALPITRWNFKGDTSTPHVGPMAQDFHAAFSLGTDERHIATVDADGVALAAIQGLNQKVEEKEARIKELEQRLEKLEQLMTSKQNDAN